MKINLTILLSFLILLALNACSPSQREKAVAHIQETESVLTSGDTLKAIGILEAIPSQFPKAKVQIEVSKKIADDLYRQLIDNRKKLLVATENKIAGLESGFIKEKTEFDSYVQYIPEKLSFKRSWNKSFIQVNLDERGEIFLTSHYMGKDWLEHTSIKVYDKELHAKTPDVPLGDPNNRKSDFLDYKWEKVSYVDGKSDSMIYFIANHAERDLKCVYMGRNYYYIILEAYNKEAIKDAWNLSCAIKQKKTIISEIGELEKKRNSH